MLKPLLARHGAHRPALALDDFDPHAFNGLAKGSRWESWNYNNQGGFGKRVLGETWLTHWGRHKVEATRGAIEPSQRGNPLLRGVTSLFGDTDVYEAYPPADATVLVRGLVLQGMTGRQITWIARHTLPMFLLMCMAVLAIWFFPQLVTLLPQQMKM